MSTAGLLNSYFHALASTSRDSLSKVEPRHAFCPRFVASVQQSHGFSAKSDDFTFKQAKTLLENHNIFQECHFVMEIYTKPAEDFAKNCIKNENLANILLDLLKFFTNRKI